MDIMVCRIFRRSAFLFLFLFFASHSVNQIHAKEVEMELSHKQMLEKGKLILNSSPSGSRVYLNGVYQGTTPLQKDLLPGIYQVKITKKNCGIVTKDIRVESGKETHQTFKLPKRQNAIFFSVLTVAAIIAAGGLLFGSW